MRDHRSRLYDTHPTRGPAGRGFMSAMYRLAIAMLLALSATSTWAADAVHPGAAIYKKQCASCHGAEGEGSKEYGSPLAGDKSVVELTKLIEKTMPADNPGTCKGEQAKQVASYVYDAFYSPIAQARSAKVRIELSRLTVAQYQQSIADLVDTFANKGKRTALTPERGLKAEYFKTSRFNQGDRVAERVDANVDFQFGEGAPLEKIEPEQFAIRWNGSLLAPETGEYEFVIRSEHVAKLYVNDLRQPLIDASIKSGKEYEKRATIRLLRGRLYPLRVEYSKGKPLGVQKKDAPTPKVASSISLKWQPPQRPLEVIPQPYLSPLSSSTVYVIHAPFPPDDRSLGYERGTSISKAWDQATTDGAIEVATYVAANLSQLAGTSDGANDRRDKGQKFCSAFAERAFRRPLSPEQQQLYIDRQFAGATETETAVKQVVLLVLKSPRFLFREVDGAPADPFNTASRLSYTLWDSLPDADLLKAAAAGQLQTREQLAKQAERMLPDVRTRAKLREFFLQWLRVDQAPDLAKDPKLFGSFTPQLTADLRTSLELFIDDTVWSDDSDFRRLLTSDQLPLNGRLAEFYGARLPADAPFQPVTLGTAPTAGVLTHPYLLASLAYTDNSSPIHRGVLISRSMLGRVLRPPPEAVAPLAADLHPQLSTRERITLQTKAEACYSCHSMINPLGFTLESFDAVGRFRQQEKGRPIDASGQYQTRTGEIVKFKDARELGKFLVSNDETRAAFVSQLFHHLVKQPVRAYGPQQLPELQRFFQERKYSMRGLAGEIAVVAALAAPQTPTTPINDNPPANKPAVVAPAKSTAKK